MNFEINKLNTKSQQTRSEFLKDLVKIILLTAIENGENTLRIDLADYDGGPGAPMSTKELLDNLDQCTRITDFHLYNWSSERNELCFSVITTAPNGRGRCEDEFSIHIFPSQEKVEGYRQGYYTTTALEDYLKKKDTLTHRYVVKSESQVEINKKLNNKLEVLDNTKAIGSILNYLDYCITEGLIESFGTRLLKEKEFDFVTRSKFYVKYNTLVMELDVNGEREIECNNLEKLIDDIIEIHNTHKEN